MWLYKVLLVSVGLKFEFEDRFYMFVMEIIDRNIVFDMEKLIIALLVSNCFVLR